MIGKRQSPSCRVEKQGSSVLKCAQVCPSVLKCAHRSSLIAHRSSLIAHHSSVLIAHRSSLIAHRSSLNARARRPDVVAKESGRREEGTFGQRHPSPGRGNEGGIGSSVPPRPASYRHPDPASSLRSARKILDRAASPAPAAATPYGRCRPRYPGRQKTCPSRRHLSARPRGDGGIPQTPP